MKAYLVNVDLMVRVIVPDDTDIESIRDAAAQKAVHYAKTDPSFVAEGVTDVEPDTECPYDPETDTAEYIALQNS